MAARTSRVRSAVTRLRRAHEGLWRSVVKTFFYRVVMVVITVVVAFAFTGNALASVSIGVTTNLIKTFTYFGYERAWARVGWGYDE